MPSEPAALVVVAAGSDAAAVGAAEHELVARGALGTERRVVSADRTLVYGGFPTDDRATAAVVADLRGRGWAAVSRPVGGGLLSAWLTHTAPVRIGERLWICFPWSEFDRQEAPAVVEIDPGLGFGTGAHPSTRLLLAELAARLRGGERVADVGSGSGVLAVAAARLGAGSVVAVDVSPAARRATAANAARNGVSALVQVSDRAAGELPGSFDVIVANIGAGTLIELAPALRARLRPGGWLGSSGLSPAQISLVAAAYRPLCVVSVPTEDDWSAVIVEASPASSLAAGG